MDSQPRFVLGNMIVTYGSAVERPNERVPIAIFCGGYRGFGFDHRIDASD